MSDDNSASLSPNSVNVILSAVTAALLLLVAWGVAEGNVIASMLSGAGLAVVIVAFGTINLVPDTMRAEATERTLAVASVTVKKHYHGFPRCRLCRDEGIEFPVPAFETEAAVVHPGAQEACLVLEFKDPADLGIEFFLRQGTVADGF